MAFWEGMMLVFQTASFLAGVAAALGLTFVLAAFLVGIAKGAFELWRKYND